MRSSNNQAARNGFFQNPMKRTRTIWGLLFALPWIIGFLGFTLVPILQSFYYSLTEYSIFRSPEWVGIDNYIYLFTRGRLFSTALKNTLYMTVFGTLLNLVVALLLALLLNTKIRARSLFRTIFYILSILPQVASSLVWMWILNSRWGLLNNFLNLLGIPSVNWFGDAAYTKPSLIMIGVWCCGNIMIIFLAALQDVPRSLYEAAEIDGAGTLSKFRHITLPSLSPSLLFQIIMGVINGFQYFTQAYIISNAGGAEQRTYGPQNSMLFYAGYMYSRGFQDFQMGLASAMAWVLFIIVAIVTVIILKSSKRWVYYGG